jgi:hypothetical protein
MLEDLDAIEDVVMIGYPVLLHDSENRYPLIRRGVTASHPAVNFDGKPKTALDIAVFPGSSGSPVLIYNMGSYFNKPLNTISLGSRTLFLGVLYEGSTINTKGKIEIQQAPTLINPAPSAISGNWQMSVMMNVGYIVKSAEIQPLVTTFLTKFGATKE